MSVKASSKKVVVLELDESLAYWLKAVVQNPLNGEEPHQEDPIQHKNRIDLFIALNEVDNETKTS